MNPADLPIRVRLEWPAGIVQYGSATKPNVQEFNAGGDRYVTVTAKLDPPFDHLAHAKAALDHEDTMNDYTAEDFKNANIAVRGTLHAARRAEPDTTLPWTYGDNEWDDDKGMVENGWRPIHEHNPHATNGWGGGALIGSPEDLSRLSNAAVPLTLDTLREAWEQAEVPTEDAPIREGDVLIRLDDDAAFDVFATQTGYHPAVGDTRVLHRAPQPEPWGELAGVLHDEAPAGVVDVDHLAERLYGAGVRVVGGATMSDHSIILDMRAPQFGTWHCAAPAGSPCHAVWDCECEQVWDYQVKGGVPTHRDSPYDENDPETHRGRFENDQCNLRDWYDNQEEDVEGEVRVSVRPIYRGDHVWFLATGASLTGGDES